jgi:hypothetical protein
MRIRMESHSKVRIAPALFLAWVLAVSLAGLTGAVAAPPRESAAPIPVRDAMRAAAREVPDTEMQRVYDEVKTPCKYGVILRPREGESVDCPNVFRRGDRWYMLYVGIRSEVGYETRLAVSDDLLSWTPIGTVLPFRDVGWDRGQADGSLALVDPAWGGSAALQPHDGRYWISYFGGAKQGYEPDPLSLGLAWTRTPTQATPWTRLEENPVLTPDQPDARPFERATLDKSHVLWDKWVLKHDGVVYHFYCAVGTEGRVIAVATSKDLRPAAPPTASGR